MAIRYVLDPAVAQDLLAREPHLRSVITMEGYVAPEEVTKRAQLTTALMNAVMISDVGKGAVVRDTMCVTSIQPGSYSSSRSPAGSPSGRVVWEAEYTVYGYYSE